MSDGSRSLRNHVAQSTSRPSGRLRLITHHVERARHARYSLGADLIMRVRSNPVAFLSSALKGGPEVPAGLRAERERIYRHGEQHGHNAVWVDEIIEPNRGPDPFVAIDDFLYELEQSKLYLALVATDWPGSPVTVGSERANATFFETELFYAAALGRPIAVIVRSDISVPPDTATLLALLRRALPTAAWFSVASSRAAEVLAKGLIDDAAAGRRSAVRDRGTFGAMLTHWWNWREPDTTSRGLRWLDDKFIPTSRGPHASIVEECLRTAFSVDSERQRLCRLWIAARELMGAPYGQTRDEHWLGLWNSFLGNWNTSAAWYGLHGHGELGYLAALHSLDDVRDVARRRNPKLSDDPEWDRPFGSLGSAYYAAAKRVASRQCRSRGLKKALEYLALATSRDPIGLSNILAIRGSVLHRLHAYPAAVETYREVMRLRTTHGASDGSLGEAMSELGFGLLFVLRWRQARTLLREGVNLMEQARYGAGFLVRAKRKYAAALFLTGHLREARSQRAEAAHLAARTSVGVAG